MAQVRAAAPWWRSTSPEPSTNQDETLTNEERVAAMIAAMISANKHWPDAMLSY